MIIRKTPRPTFRQLLPLHNKKHPYNRHFVSTYSGRYAIYQVLRLLGLQSDNEVLLPAYHCLAMVQPIMTFGCRPVLYRIDSTLQTTIDHVMKRVSGQTRVVVLVHHFGIYQKETETIARELARMGIILMEDCAHIVPFSRQRGGSVGDIAFYTPWKFLPLLDGAILRFNNQNIRHEMNLAAPPLHLAIKNAKNVLDRELASSAKGVLGRLYLFLDQALRRGRTLLPGTLENRFASTDISFDDRYAKFKATSLSRWATRSADFEGIYRRRGQICSSLFEQIYQTGLFEPPPFLPGNAVDCIFGFPIMVRDREQAVPFLRSKQIPHFTFGDRLHDEQSLESNSPELRYSRSLLFVPLLQDFGPGEVAYLAENVKELLSRGL
jgi:perosamine synthetase